MKKYENQRNITGNLLKKARIEKSMSKTDLSLKLELQGIYLTQTEIHRIEENKMSLKDFELIGLVKTLNIDFNELKDLLE